MQKYHHLHEIIQSRRSIFPQFYNDEAVTEEELNIIFDAARYAPTHKLTQPWRFTIYLKNTFPKFIKALEQAMIDQNMLDVSQKLSRVTSKLEKSQALALVGTHLDPVARLPHWEEVAATAMAVQNVWLLASQLNIGTYWSSPAFLTESGIDLGHSGEVQCLGLMYFGKYDKHLELPDRLRKEVGDYTVIIK